MSLRSIGRVMVSVGVLALGLAWGVASARADYVYSFQNITFNSPSNVDVGSQLSMSVSSTGNLVSFLFQNNVGLTSSLASIFVDDKQGSPYFAGFQGLVNNGTVFQQDSPPRSFMAFDTVDYSFGAQIQKGVNSATRSVGLTFTLNSGKDFDSVLAGLRGGDLRFGLHVQGIGSANKSDKFVNRVPEPSTLAALAGMAVFGSVCFWRKRRRRAE